MKKPRHLSKDERDIWDRVARSATPLNPSPLRKPEMAPPRKVEKPVRPEDPLPEFRVGSRADVARPHDTLGPLGDRLRARPVNMDAKNFGRMSRGKLKPEARIDLHGMTLAEAHPELVRFMLHAVDRGRRLVLVITGKGQRSGTNRPRRSDAASCASMCRSGWRCRRFRHIFLKCVRPTSGTVATVPTMSIYAETGRRGAAIRTAQIARTPATRK